MYKFLSCLLFLFFFNDLHAQTPAYFFSRSPLDSNGNGGFGGWSWSDVPLKIQQIYRPKDFAATSQNLRRGMITAIYFRADWAPFFPNTAKIPNFKVSMARTTWDTVNTGTPHAGIICRYFDEELAGLTTVISGNPYYIADTIEYQKWFRLPLQTPFYCDSVSNILVQITSDSNTVVLNPPDSTYPYGLTGPDVYVSLVFDSARLLVIGNRDSTYPYGCNIGIMQLGFDIDTTIIMGVEELSQAPKPAVYPNPAMESLYIANGKEKEAYKIYNLTGQLLLQGYNDGKGINVSMLSPGLYIFRLGAETLRFVKQ